MKTYTFSITKKQDGWYSCQCRDEDNRIPLVDMFGKWVRMIDGSFDEVGAREIIYMWRDFLIAKHAPKVDEIIHQETLIV